jgi:pimeloyl-ACP methyl ester carboxylesterase
MNVGRIVSVLALLLSGCTSLEPIRRLNDVGIDCSTIDKKGHVAEACANQLVETAATYRLHFVEYDDQGRPYADLPQFGLASQQESLFLSDVRRASTSPDGFTVVVFVHGWKHSSAVYDENLMAFRRLLDQLAKVERVALCRREVIGLYVGWRGKGGRMGDALENLTFWSRKHAAEQVADGALTDVFASLDAIRQSSGGPTERGASDIDCGNKVTYVGHSFGGLVVTIARKDALIHDIAQDRERMLTGPPPPRDRDLVIAINPAMEGTRFDALFRMSQAVRYPQYQAPRYVAITSRDDDKTGTFFPIGRRVNSATKHFPKGDASGRQATVTAMGHDPQYITHDLANFGQLDGKPAPPPPVAECQRWAAAKDYAERAKIDLARARAFFASEGFPSDGAPLVRYFCTDRESDTAPPETTVLVVKQRNGGLNPYSAIWNLQTRKPTVESHGDFHNPRLVEFLRQLYIESLFKR